MLGKEKSKAAEKLQIVKMHFAGKVCNMPAIPKYILPTRQNEADFEKDHRFDKLEKDISFK